MAFLTTITTRLRASLAAILEGQRQAVLHPEVAREVGEGTMRLVAKIWRGK